MQLAGLGSDFGAGHAKRICQLTTAQVWLSRHLCSEKEAICGTSHTDLNQAKCLGTCHSERRRGKQESHSQAQLPAQTWYAKRLGGSQDMLQLPADNDLSVQQVLCCQFTRQRSCLLPRG